MENPATVEDFKKEIEKLKQIVQQKEDEGIVLRTKIEELEGSQSNNDYRRFKILSNATAEALFILKDGKYVEANEAGCKLFGYNYEEIIGQSATFVVHEGYQELMLRNITQELDTPYEVICRRKDQTIFEAEMHGRMFTIDGERFRVTTVRNVEKRKLAEARMARNEQKFRALFEHAGVGIIMANESGSITEANPTFCQLMGKDPELVIGKNLSHLFSETSLKEKPLLFDELEVGRLIVEEREMILDDGTLVPIEMNYKKINSDYFISIFRDLTEQKKYTTELLSINEELKFAKDKAEESDKLKSIFLANMSHEIRTPMNGIIGFSELLKNPDTPEEKRNDFADIVINSGNQLLQIIDDILEISRLETRQVKVNLNEISLNSLMLELFNLYSEKAKDNKLALYIKKGLSDTQSLVQTDITKLRKILYNLIENAMRYTNKGFIEIGYQLIGNEIEIYVKDTGIGIRKEQMDAIFERFSQGDKSLSNKFGGLGLGLSIAKENAELLNGSIIVESDFGVGSTFKVRIPYNTGTDVVVQEVEEYDYKVLVAEDEEVNALYLEILLNKYNPRIKPLMAKNGLEAVEVYKENQDVDLILMDIKMPVMNGLKATRQILKINSTVPIVAQTAHVTSEDRQNAFEAGCVDFITKPVKEKHLIEKLEKLNIKSQKKEVANT